MNKTTFELEKDLLNQGYELIIGVDEVGRGPLAGPVVACAVAFRNQASGFRLQELKQWDLVRDSKTLSEKQREKIFDFIHEHFHVGIGLCDHHTIDRINILEASFLAMKKAVAELVRNKLKVESSKLKVNEKIIVLVDGNKQIPNFSHEQKAVIGGDGLVKSIAAASIIAKVTRDKMMMDVHKKYPSYGFDKHKGYGTKLHMDMINTHGPCEIHRKSFQPVAKRLKIAESC